MPNPKLKRSLRPSDKCISFRIQENPRESYPPLVSKTAPGAQIGVGDPDFSAFLKRMH